MIAKNRGGFSELVACAWLMSLGYDVFRNTSDNGPIDMVAVDRDTGETVFVDSKTITPTSVKSVRKNGYKRSPKQKALNVRIVGVTHESECFWVTHKD